MVGDSERTRTNRVEVGLGGGATISTWFWNTIYEYVHVVFNPINGWLYVFSVKMKPT